MALTDKGVQKDLKLSDDQASKIQTIGTESMTKLREKMQDLRDSGASQDEIRKAADDARKEGEKKAMDVLTADQKTAFDQMKGKTLKIPRSELRMPGFGGRGGRRGGGGGGGGGDSSSPRRLSDVRPSPQRMYSNENQTPRGQPPRGAFSFSVRGFRTV